MLTCQSFLCTPLGQHTICKKIINNSHINADADHFLHDMSNTSRQT